jgi:hypothetical protein
VTYPKEAPQFVEAWAGRGGSRLLLDYELNDLGSRQRCRTRYSRANTPFDHRRDPSYMVIIPVCDHNELDGASRVDPYRGQIIKGRRRTGIRMQTRINDNPFAGPEVNTKRLAIAASEDGNLKLVRPRLL